MTVVYKIQVLMIDSHISQHFAANYGNIFKGTFLYWQLILDWLYVLTDSVLYRCLCAPKIFVICSPLLGFAVSWLHHIFICWCAVFYDNVFTVYIFHHHILVLQIFKISYFYLSIFLCSLILVFIKTLCCSFQSTLNHSCKVFYVHHQAFWISLILKPSIPMGIYVIPHRVAGCM